MLNPLRWEPEVAALAVAIVAGAVVGVAIGFASAPEIYRNRGLLFWLDLSPKMQSYGRLAALLSSARQSGVCPNKTICGHLAAVMGRCAKSLASQTPPFYGHIFHALHADWYLWPFLGPPRCRGIIARSLALARAHAGPRGAKLRQIRK
jgi:hypothetical protein